jgi:hypothetical protein
MDSTDASSTTCCSTFDYTGATEKERKKAGDDSSTKQHVVEEDTVGDILNS